MLSCYSKYTCTQCAWEYTSSGSPSRYEYALVSRPDRKTEKTVFLRILSRQAWCCSCHTLRMVEEIPLPATLEKELADAESRDKRDQDAIEELRLRVLWRKARKSPPRCLECGSTLIAYPDFEKREENFFKTVYFTHDCGGHLCGESRKSDLHVRWKLPVPRRYDPEGNALPETGGRGKADKSNAEKETFLHKQQRLIDRVASRELPGTAGMVRVASSPRDFGARIAEELARIYSTRIIWYTAKEGDLAGSAAMRPQNENVVLVNSRMAGSGIPVIIHEMAHKVRQEISG